MNAVVLVALAFSAPIDFDTDVLPVLARAGCNAGACHGAAAGRGGFRLSLFGGDPAADYRAIVQELEGRRVNLAHPEQSLLLRKPTWELDHEGGQRFESDSPQAALLTQWIAQGAPRLQSRQATKLVVDPRQITVPTVPAEVTLTVSAQFGDGSSRRVEDVALFTPVDPSATEIDARGRVSVRRPGRHAIVVRYLTHVAAVQITAPYPSLLPATKPGPQPRGNWIDDEINAALVGLRLPAAPPTDDATLLRRAALDLTGRLPTAGRIREFLVDQRTQSEKFAAQIDRLLASPEFAEYWTYKFARRLQVRVGPNDAPGTKALHAWLRQQIESGRPLDKWARELLTTDGDAHAAGPPNFYRNAADARGQAEYVAQSLLGIRLACANCHNHPLDRWTQDDYHGLAAIFARLDRGQFVRLKAAGEVVHPATGEAAMPRIPGERFLPPDQDNRVALAEWITGGEQRRFAQAQINHLWQAMFGRGLVDPVDDLRDTNPASHPELLERLADELIQSGYDLRSLLRLIAGSATYQRSSQPPAETTGDDRFYSHTSIRPLEPAVLLDLLGDATSVASSRGSASLAAQRTIALYDLGEARAALGPLVAEAETGGCVRGGDGAREGDGAGCLEELTVQLHWINGPIVNERIASEASWFAELARSAASPGELIEAYYLRTLSRLPTQAETAHWVAELAEGDRAAKCQDFAWALLTCREFVTNH